MWIEPLVVIFQAPLARNPLGVIIVLLLGLPRPWEEEPTSAATFETILRRTAMEIKPSLNVAGQPSNAEHLIIKPTIVRSRYGRPDHLRHDPPSMDFVVNIILLIWIDLFHCVGSWPLSLLSALNGPLHCRDCFVPLVDLPSLEPYKDVTVQSATHLSLCAVPEILRFTQGRDMTAAQEILFKGMDPPLERKNVFK